MSSRSAWQKPSLQAKSQNHDRLQSTPELQIRLCAAAMKGHYRVQNFNSRRSPYNPLQMSPTCWGRTYLRHDAATEPAWYPPLKAFVIAYETQIIHFQSRCLNIGAMVEPQKPNPYSYHKSLESWKKHGLAKSPVKHHSVAIFHTQELKRQIRE